MNIRVITYLFVVNLAMIGCSNIPQQRYHDSQIKYSKDDFSKILRPAIQSQPKPIIKKKPITKPKIVIPSSLKTIISMTIKGQVPIKQVLMEIASQIKGNITIDKAVRGRITITAYNRPCIAIISDLCELHNLVYKINGDNLHIMVDKPYLRTYSLKSLSLVIENTIETSVSTDIFNRSNKDSTKMSSGGGSQTIINAKSKNDFWLEMDNNVKALCTSLAITHAKEPLHYIINKQAGLITITANNKCQKIFESYFQQLSQSLASQVLIEAKIIEITLEEQYNMGINWGLLWNKFNLGSAGVKFNPLGDQVTMPEIGSQQGQFGFAHKFMKNSQQVGKMQAVANLFDHFGSVRAIANPRITVTNNQTAILKVVTNEIFFDIKEYKQRSNPFIVMKDKIGPRQEEEPAHKTAHINSVPVGFIISVHPVIDIDKDQVTLYMHPVISKDIKTVSHPFVGPDSKIPVIQVREISSITHLHNNQIIVLGGLMYMSNDNQQSGLPINLPPLSTLAKKKINKNKIRELVILLKCTILNNKEDTIHDQDKKIYDNMITDSRRWSM